NHMLDKGEIGYANTIEYFNSLPVTMIGGYTKSDYDNIRIVEKQGVKIAFLSYTTLVNYGHANSISNSSKYVIPYANTDDITRHVMLAKEQADVVIVSMHWGSEGAYSATNEQIKYAKLCANLGVDAVIGHHSHVVGDVEWVTGESGNRTLVAYSLGNFCSSQLYSYNMVGEMIKFDIVKDEDGIISIENVVVDPVICHYKTDTSHKDNQDLYVRYDVRMYMMRDYTNALVSSHGSQNWGAFSFNTLKGYISGSSYADISNEFLPVYMQ
ncbi:MAG: CapA family protein, partial [Clostridia bacterium]|nr:CapA family protein [Clostridia bacterium]